MKKRSSAQSTTKLKEGRGRPLSFDRDCALDAAMRAFWERGYEGTSMHDLKEAMGLSASSIYAAFGGKERLYAEAVDRYTATVGGFSIPILKEADGAKEAIERLLLTTARELTRPDQPKGCMISISLMHGASDVASVRASMTKRRAGGIELLRELIQKDVDLGRLPKGVRAVDLASFYMAVIQGMSARVRDGVSRSAMESIAATAMKAWPSA